MSIRVRRLLAAAFGAGGALAFKGFLGFRCITATVARPLLCSCVFEIWLYPPELLLLLVATLRLVLGRVLADPELSGTLGACLSAAAGCARGCPMGGGAPSPGVGLGGLLPRSTCSLAALRGALKKEGSGGRGNAATGPGGNPGGSVGGGNGGGLPSNPEA